MCNKRMHILSTSFTIYIKAYNNLLGPLKIWASSDGTGCRPKSRLCRTKPNNTSTGICIQFYGNRFP
ncbi:hypothetical protein Hanom_Chr02g00096241 [Helianthus anomalus]